jgi:outer membrane receptor protein involved in Fe transport
MASAAIAAAAPAQAQSTPQINYNIPAQDLGKALTDLARQSNREIYFSSDLTRGKRAPAVKGAVSTDQALRQLLAGSGLTYKLAASGAITIERELGNGPNGAETASLPGGDAAQSDKGIAEILVVGKKTQNVDIRRTRDDPQPYMVFDSDQIKSSGANNLEEFFRKSLTANSQSRSAIQATSDDFFASNVGHVNLRGLGDGKTLILIDGRRAPRLVGEGGAPTQADINGIPLESIERIEVLPSTASGIYGGGAVGGVVNIIRKRNYKGVTANLGIDVPTSGGGRSFNADVTAATTIAQTQTQISAYYSYRHSNPLLVEDNSLYKNGRSKYFAYALSSPDFPSPPIGATPNIVSASGENLTLKNGTALNSPYSFVPPGYQGAGSDGGAQLAIGAGAYNQRLSDDIYGKLGVLRGAAKVHAGGVSINQKLTRAIDLYLDLSGFSNQSSTFTSAGGFYPNAYIPASAPTNPFNQDIVVSFPIPSFKAPNLSKSTMIAGTGGIVARLGSGWTASLEYQRSQSSQENRLLQDAISFDLNDAISNGDVDVLKDPTLYLNDVRAFMTAADFNTFLGPYRNRQNIFSARLAGTVGRINDNRINVSSLLEYRKELVLDSKSEGPFGTVAYPSKSQSIRTAYSEIRIPIFAPANDVPLLDEMELQGSIRYDVYKTTFASPDSYFLLSPDAPVGEFTYSDKYTEALSYTVAGKWAPVHDLAFRASYASGFLPPNVSQLFSRSFRGFVGGLRDPRRNNELIGLHAPYNIRVGGSPSLEPEKYRSLSAGLIVQPRWIPTLRASLDYSRIKTKGEIDFPDTSSLLNNETLYPGRIVRAPNLPSDPPGILGPITLIDRTLINLKNSKVVAWDMRLDYSFRLAGVGIDLFGSATLQTDFVRQERPELPPKNLVGFSNGPLKWRGNGGVTLSRDAWKLYWNTQYYGKYDIGFGGVNLDATNELIYVIQGTRKIPSQIYNDVSVLYEFQKSNGISRGLSLQVGIINIFNKKPPTIVEPIGGYSLYGDPRLRRITASLRKTF